MSTEIPEPARESEVSDWSDEVDVLVVGAGMGGVCAALEAARGGARVLVVDKGGEGTCTSAMAGGHFYLGGGTAVQRATGHEDSADHLLDTVDEHFGRLDGVVISVGGPPAVAAARATDDQWRGAFETVFLGAVRLARTALVTATGPLAVTFVLSSSVRAPLRGLAISNGLRPGLAMVAKTLADEFGGHGHRAREVALDEAADVRDGILRHVLRQTAGRAGNVVPVGVHRDHRDVRDDPVLQEHAEVRLGLSLDGRPGRLAVRAVRRAGVRGDVAVEELAVRNRLAADHVVCAQEELVRRMRGIGLVLVDERRRLVVVAMHIVGRTQNTIGAGR